MPSDEELRRVAEDLRALGRSLARDLRHAAETASRDGRSPADAVRRSLHDLAGEARRSVGGGRRARWYGPPAAGPGAWWTPPGPGGPPGGPGRPAGPGWDAAPPPPGAGPGRGAPAGPRCGPGRRPGWGAVPPPARPRGRRGRHPDAPPVRRRWDATTVAGALALLFGTAWLLGVLGAVHVPVEAVVAVGLVILGLAVVVTARTDWSLSRRSWPVWLGALLLVVLVATSAASGVDGTLRHVSFGTMSATARPGATVYGGFGNLTVDAGGLGAGQRVTVESVAGETLIRIPAATAVWVDVHLLSGQVCVSGHDMADGAGASYSGAIPAPASPPAPGTPPITGSPAVIAVHQMAGRVLIGGSGCSR